MKTILVLLMATAIYACPQFESQYHCENNFADFNVNIEEVIVDGTHAFDVHFSFYTDRVFTDGLKREFLTNNYVNAYTMGSCSQDTLSEVFAGKYKNKYFIEIVRDYIKTEDGLKIVVTNLKDNELISEKKFHCLTVK
ncbi:hypothetical protein DAY19_14420 [Halobacteriovorax vibrionivorans]|uniref:Lipoprotein n=1 Tax=Halobacteriovorax vibrionivorans TaxID=2152716 RepID=A0ABY0IF64_9BACT|nr:MULTISPECIES: hypothetical protein [Halobacteriovorax]RZF21169.1 hypothetical protein DAY19_14420 [Halobacteriovorax vibrionivorans]TGD46070.1 hypothetical protein EP118_13465 [Halobacteriovorax sp. Y22]